MNMMMVLFAVCGLLAGMLLLLELGRRIGIRRQTRDPEAFRDGSGPVQAAVFGLMGLLVAFTFSAAASRYDVRRKLIVDEANMIGTAYLRLDLLPASAQAKLREDFRSYLRSRLAVYQKLPDIKAARAELARAAALQNEIWQQAVVASKEAGSPAVPTLVLPMINQMIDITTTRTASLQMHQPFAVFVMLAVTVLGSSLLAGYSMASAKTRNWVHIFSFVLLLAAAVYVIVDLEYPRLGLIRVDPLDEVLVQTLRNMH